MKKLFLLLLAFPVIAGCNPEKDDSPAPEITGIVTEYDGKAVAVPVLHHRVVLAPEARITKENADDILTALVRKARIPKE